MQYILGVLIVLGDVLGEAVDLALVVIDELRECLRISGAGLRESHVHDVTITRESPNYPSRV